MNPMDEHAVLVDANVVLHALGNDGGKADRCRVYLESLWEGRGRAYASREMLQEMVHHRMRRDSRELAVAAVRRVEPMFIVLNFDHEVLELARELIERTNVRGRDAVHAATALAYGIETIASSDPAFDGIPGLLRVDPLAA
ncbi:type II toxin-antitoxin system VapC family toxin [Paramicrobacterium chengjingii]|uniref:Ribonuclease VapC n=1 Tax=Paramicrobacterium chengjingii TaxID=2769067 RepID=A0ABX6YKI7_9MICO|nr:type II toxin-antitoxin system VapC family toxin [Microbacterium chengjingii]QPZ38865.1 type II toxin-antitoxin system VapC family toxin [Microbacterium chengjingii]